MHAALVQVDEAEWVAAAHTHARKDDALELWPSERAAEHSQRGANPFGEPGHLALDHGDAQGREVVWDGGDHVAIAGKETILLDQIKVRRAVKKDVVVL